MIEIKHLSKTFSGAEGVVEALKDINLSVADGDVYGIIGMSGAGKSTLVRCINLLERPSAGTVVMDGVDLCDLSASDLRKKRREITMIFQKFNLLMQRTCLRNVCFPMELEGMSAADRTPKTKNPVKNLKQYFTDRAAWKQKIRKRAAELLDLVGLPDKAGAYPAQLSGGQQQRVAIARALATKPKVLLCDEATSALDPNTTHAILGLIRDINRRLGITVIVITHQMSVVQEICNRVAILDGGSVAESGTVGEVFSSPKSAAAKRLVFPGGEDDIVSDPSHERRFRLLFSGAEATGTPLISSLAIERGVRVNILSAATRLIDGKIYGTMLLGIPEEGTMVEDAREYISRENNVFYEEL